MSSSMPVNVLNFFPGMSLEVMTSTTPGTRRASLISMSLLGGEKKTVSRETVMHILTNTTAHFIQVRILHGHYSFTVNDIQIRIYGGVYPFNNEDNNLSSTT